MTLPGSLRHALAAHVGGPVQAVQSVGGGCIARACRVAAPAGVFFLKWGTDDVARTFPAEAAGLAALAEAGSPLIVPQVIATAPAADGQPGFMLSTWIETGAPARDFWTAFGAGLAALHRHTASGFGFGIDNFIGRLPQHNTWCDDWVAFFRSRRLEPQVAWARAAGRWQADWNDALHTLYRRLPELLPAAPPPALLHGDLWSGNFMVNDRGTAVLIDPAAYYGHREADLAMTQLFGSFAQPFYDAYRSAWPLPPGFEARFAIYNLYHLINHLNHFGGAYAGGVAATLKRFA